MEGSAVDVNDPSEADEQWVNELCQKLMLGINEDRYADVVSLAKASLPRVRQLHGDDGVVAFVLHQCGHALCALGQKKNKIDEEGFHLLEEATRLFEKMEMSQQAGASLGVMSETSLACGFPLRAADLCLRTHPLVNAETQDFLLFTWWDCLGHLTIPDQMTHLEHLLRLYYSGGGKRKDWSTPEGLMRLALAERLYGVHQFDKAKEMLLAALADPDPRLRDMLKRSKITVALCVEGEKSGAIAEKLKTDKTVVTPYRVCRACRKVAENLSICSGCRKVWYCNAAEQQLDWSTHKTTCKK